MSKYTTEVRYICESYAGLEESGDYTSVNDVVAKAAPLIFESYPLFDENYRKQLNEKILKHFYTREIGFETVGLWKLKLNAKMSEIMPYYNKLYESELIKFDPMKDFVVETIRNRVKNGSTNVEGNRESEETKSDTKNFNKNEGMDSTKTSENSENTNAISNDTQDTLSNTKTEQNGTNANHSSNVGTGNTENGKEQLKVYADTPQGGLEGISPDGSNLTYATNITKDTGKDKGSSISTSQGENEGTAHNDEKMDATGKVTGTSTDNVNKENNGKDTVNEKGSTSSVEAANSVGSDSEKKMELTTINSVDDWLENISGKKSGESYSKLLKEYRQSFINIDMMIIEELSDLFMLLW